MDFVFNEDINRTIPIEGEDQKKEEKRKQKKENKNRRRRSGRRRRRTRRKEEADLPAVQVPDVINDKGCKKRH